MSVRLNKTQIDKVSEAGPQSSGGKADWQSPLFQAAKDKSGKFHDNFNVTLFLVRPNDQTLQEEFSRSNMICQVTTTQPQPQTWPLCPPPARRSLWEQRGEQRGGDGRAEETPGGAGLLLPGARGEDHLRPQLSSPHSGQPAGQQT